MIIEKTKQSLDSVFTQLGFIDPDKDQDVGNDVVWYRLQPDMPNTSDLTVKVTNTNIIFRGFKKGVILCMIPLNKEIALSKYTKKIEGVKEACRKLYDNIELHMAAEKVILPYLIEDTEKYGIRIDSGYNFLDNAGICIAGSHKDIMVTIKNPISYFSFYINSNYEIVRENTMAKYDNIMKELMIKYLDIMKESKIYG